MRAVKTAVRAEQPPGLEELHVAVASVEPGTGAVRALYGGPDYLGNRSDAQVNWATAGAQPGSTFKVFALLPRCARATASAPSSTAARRTPCPAPAS
jgi:membrane peptidoglycan carboxypeptidase